MDYTPNQTCCFTGHRTLPPAVLETIKAKLRSRVLGLLAEGVLYYKVGGAVGFDTLAAEVLFDLCREHPEMRVALYYPFDGFTSSWTAEQVERYCHLRPLYDEVICCVSPPPRRPADAYLLRDRRLVDGSGVVVAYCTRRSGGTAYTLRYAQRAGCTIYNLADK